MGSPFWTSSRRGSSKLYANDGVVAGVKGGVVVAKDKLTARQQAFVEAYAGNATAAALAAGYSERSARSQGQRLLTNDDIKDAIKAREAQRLAPTIATRQERQEFWTSVLRSKDEAMKDRLKAAELLGKSEGDFLERVEMDQTVSVNVFDEETRARLLEMVGRG